MSYFEDLSEYTYGRSYFCRPGTRNIGWLASGHDFPKAAPTEELLNLIWNFCRISVAQTRGWHLCEFCPETMPPRPNLAERDGEKLLLGTSEIRAFGPSGEIYAAPTLIYHYISAHGYWPPDEFLQAIREGPQPPAQVYFDRLAALGLEWGKTLSHPEKLTRAERTADGELRIVEFRIARG